MDWLSAFRQRKNKSPSANSGEKVAWMPIWEDSILLEQINANARKKNIKKAETEVKVKFLAYEATSRIEEEPLPNPPLTQVQKLMSGFDALSTEDVLGLSPLSLTTPRVAKIENPIALMTRGEDRFEIEVAEIERQERSEAMELRKLLQEAADYKGDMTRNGSLTALYAQLNDLKKSDPTLAQDLAYAVGTERKPKVFEFHNKNYALLMSHFGDYVVNDADNMMGGGVMLPVLVPVEGYSSLPFGDMFFGQVLGVLYYNAKPMFKNLPPGPVLVAAAISEGTRVIE